MINEKLFDDAIQLASLWLTKSKAAGADAYRSEVEATIQTIYLGLLAVRDRLETGKF